MASTTRLLSRRTLGDLAEAAVIGTATAAWIAVADESAPRRWISRMLIAATAIGVPLPRPDPERSVLDAAQEVPRERENPSEHADGSNGSGLPSPKLVVTVSAGVAVAVVSRVMVAGVERRWLQSLAATHQRPRRALAARFGVVASAASRLLDRRRRVERSRLDAAP